jgi:hypothetical protein
MTYLVSTRRRLSPRQCVDSYDELRDVIAESTPGCCFKVATLLACTGLSHSRDRSRGAEAGALGPQIATNWKGILTDLEPSM